MFAVVVTLTLKSEEAGKFRDLIRENAAASLAKEEGCMQFDIATDPDRPEDVLLYEIYTDAAAFDAHLKTPHFLQFDQATADMVLSKDVRTYAQVIQ